MGDLLPRNQASEQAKERDQWHCQITGQGGIDSDIPVEAAHLHKAGGEGHAGVGGNPQGENPDNLITLHKHLHDIYDGRSNNYNGSGDNKGYILKNGTVLKPNFIIERWEPEDKEEGLIVRNPKANNPVPKESLFFYHKPSQELLEKAWQAHQDWLEALAVSRRATAASIEHLRRLKEETVNGKPLFKGILKHDGGIYESWQEFFRDRIKGVIWDKRQSTLEQYMQQVPKLQRLEDWRSLPRGIWNTMGAAIRDEERGLISEDELETLRYHAINSDRQEFEQVNKEIRGQGEEFIPSCKNCAHSQNMANTDLGEEFSLGDRTIWVCDMLTRPIIISSYSTQEAIDQAEHCQYYEEQGG